MATAARPRRRLDPKRRRAEVLEAASTLFEAVPFDQLTIEDLADGCGVSVGLLYHYFGTKRDLYVACLERSLEQFIAAIRDPGPEHPLDERLQVSLDSYLDWVVEHPQSYVAVLRGGVGVDAQVHSRVEKAREAFAALVFEGLGIRKPDAGQELAVWGWMGFVEAVCSRWLTETERVSRAELRDLLAASTLDVFGRIMGGAAGR